MTAGLLGDNTSHLSWTRRKLVTVTAVKGRMDEEALARLAAAPWAQLSRLSEARGLEGHGAWLGKRSVR